MSTQRKIAVVTGANRGIGFQIAKDLIHHDFHVILTARDEQKGVEACSRLKNDYVHADFHVCDVTSDESVEKFAQWLENEYGRCDVLINNAGIFPDSSSSSGSNWPGVFETSIDTMRIGMETNVYGPMRLCQAIVPIMRKNNYGRIVNLSSGMGQLTHMNGGCPSYRMSKTSLNALTKILSEELKDTNILVNCMCPGWVKTDMGGPGATRELPQGADTAIYLATLPQGGSTGKFFRDRKEFEW